MADELDGEVILLDMQSKCYFSLNKTASDVWVSLKDTDSFSSSIERLSNLWKLSQDVVETMIQLTLKQLCDNELLSVSEAFPADLSAAVLADSVVPPMIDKYDDMQELLDADPIHDVVDVEGWPAISGNAKT